MNRILSIIVPATPLVCSADEYTSIETECLYGEQFEVLGESDGWVNGRLLTDGYSGWIRTITTGILPPASHRVVAIRSVVTAGVDVKTRTVCTLSMGSRVSVLETIGHVSKIVMEGTTAYIASHHIVPVEHTVDDWVGTAERFVGVPYRWGGRDSLGLDCSALVQLALQSAGIKSPRNSSDQQELLGKPRPLRSINVESDCQRGDLVFWPGHVGIMLDDSNLLHANAYHRQVAIEPLKDAASRILPVDGQITSVNRLIT